MSLNSAKCTYPGWPQPVEPAKQDPLLLIASHEYAPWSDSCALGQLSSPYALFPGYKFIKRGFKINFLLL